MVTFVVVIYVGTYCALIIFYEDPLARNLKKGETLFTSEFYNMPFIPNFFELLSQDAFMYEGIAMVPALYSNARDQQGMHKVLAASLLAVGLAFGVYCPMCYIAFGD